MIRLLLVFLALSAVVGNGEVTPPASLPCFPGAYYRKAVSSFDDWTGIEGLLTLPNPIFDETRKSAQGRFLDNPSIYMGGRAANEEIDAGLTWAGLKQTDDGSISKEGKAFRIFWRNDKWHMGPKDPELTFFPGDTIRMRCETTERGKLKLNVQLLSRGNHAPQEFQSKTNGLFETEFSAVNFGPKQVQQFKRVNAIDQVGREGKSADPTATKVLSSTWHEVWLLRGTNRVPMTPEKFTDMRCPSADHLEVVPFQQSGERISIIGGAAR